MLADVPLVMILAGVAAYAVLAGADFGAGIWTILSGPDREGAKLREHARHAIGPVWEANHVWLIFVLVISWTAYPVAFGSIMSTLTVPLFVAALGIILRGTAYALRGQTEGTRLAAPIERLFGLSSILTPFALGTVAGGIASGRVAVGNAAGSEWRSWLNPTSAILGVMFVATCGYLAAVYLAADARRLREPGLEAAFRRRALGGGVVAGALALAGLLVVRSDARPIWDGLTSGAGVAALIVSAAAGLATMALVWRGRFEAARAAAAIAVAAIIAGWALAQRPQLLPGLTVHQAAAPHATLVALTIAASAGSLILLPALFVLFRLYLGGTFDPLPGGLAETTHRVTGRAARPLKLAVPGVLLVGGTVSTVLFDPVWTRIVGVAALLAFAAIMFGPVAILGAGENEGRGPD
jgi:cytochrome d ubiquinol oxidase subunit II